MISNENRKNASMIASLRKKPGITSSLHLLEAQLIEENQLKMISLFGGVKI